MYTIVSAGSSPKHLPVFETAEDKVNDKITTYKTKEDFLDLEENISNSKCKNIAVIGGGFLGSELACVLARNCTFRIYLFLYLFINEKILKIFRIFNSIL